MAAGVKGGDGGGREGWWWGMREEEEVGGVGGLEPDISGASAPRRSTPAHSHCVFSAAYSL